MSVTRELIDYERQAVQSGRLRDIHLHREGTFLRAYDWSAWLCCRYLHDFKVNKRQFKGIDDAVAYIGFPETSIGKWLPEDAEQRVEDDKHLVLTLPESMLDGSPAEALQAEYDTWKEALPLSEAKAGQRKNDGGRLSVEDGEDSPATLTAIMQRVLAFPIESKSPIESMMFLADIKQRLASLI